MRNERNKRENGHKYVCLIKFYLHILFCLVALRIFEVLHMVQVHVGKATPQQSKVRAESSYYGNSESHQSPAVNKNQQNSLNISFKCSYFGITDFMILKFLA